MCGSCSTKDDAVELLRSAEGDLEADLDGVRKLIAELGDKPVEDIDPAYIRQLAHTVTESLSFNLVRVFEAANWVDGQHGIPYNG